MHFQRRITQKKVSSCDKTLYDELLGGYNWATTYRAVAFTALPIFGYGGNNVICGLPDSTSPNNLLFTFSRYDPELHKEEECSFRQRSLGRAIVQSIAFAGGVMGIQATIRRAFIHADNLKKKPK